MIKAKGRKFILFTIITLIVMGVLLSVLFISLGFKNVKRVEVKADYALENGNIDTQYNNHSVFTISAFSTLQYFAESIEAGYNYQGKTVKLVKNIDCGGSEFSGIGGGSYETFQGKGSQWQFHGTFDGCGYEISNYKLTGYFCYSSRTIKGQKKYNYTYDYYIGLFINLGPNAQINNLKVSNCSFAISEKADNTGNPGHDYYYNYHYACLVANKSYGGNTPGGTVNTCIVNSSNDVNIGTVSINNTLILNGSSASVIGTNVYGSINKYPPTNLGSLNISSQGGKNVTIWYRAEGYNNGWPIPRVFIGWKTVSFSGTDVSFSPTSIQIPNDANNTFKGSGNTITIYGQVVTANSSLCHYSASSWTANSVTSYTASFTAVNRTVTINVYNTNTNTTEKWKEIIITCGGSVTISATAYEQLSVYSSCVIGGNSYTPPDDNYYIELSQNSNMTGVHEDKTITITIKKKNYQIGFE